MSFTLATPYEARVDLTQLTDAELLEEYGVFTGEFAEMVTPGRERSERYGKREDSYAKNIKFQLWLRCYDPAYRAALAHPSIFTESEAEIAAEAAMDYILDFENTDGLWASCKRGLSLAKIAAGLATKERALDEVHRGTVAKSAGARTDLGKPVPAANRRIYATDPHGYGFDAARSISADGLSYDLTAVEDAIDQERFGALTETEAAVEWLVETAMAAGVTRDEALTWVHTTGLTDEVQQYIDLVIETGAHEEAGRLADQRRFPLEDIAALTGDSLATVKRRIKKTRDAVYSDCTITGSLRSGSVGTRRAEVNGKTLAFALTTSLKAHAQQAGQTLTKALVRAVPNAFFADYIAEYMADGTVAADIDPALIVEMRAAAEAVAA
ncbi:hypothetical protein [Microbacterium sp. MRS-1]|uniref:hypothetical protein n=1 Tax=Microbacterium sp. MRS-1 TaxID=1451261 RepID=UPI00044BF0D3|nr:hypothetical protein [Microbacterium sp. MRS-1]EXJ50742.1 hypothetical protein AS96_12940 [Microbacterium sp. MRS-1]